MSYNTNPTHYTARQDRLRELMRGRGVSATALVPGANMVYFTGLHFHLSERPTVALILADGGMAFIIPELEYTKLTDVLEPFAIDPVFRWTDVDGYDGAFEAAANALGWQDGRIGVDDNTMRVFELLAVQSAVPEIQIAKLGATLLNIRARKTPDEVERIQRAIRLSEAALKATLAEVHEGMTERQIADLLTAHLNANGTQGLAFAPLVLIGENSALPHGVVGGRKLGAGDTLLFDFGGMVDGYPADITRTFVYGEPSDEVRAIYSAVEQANAAARAVVAPGVPCAVVDRAAREVIEAAGYGEYFLHRTGHGIGLEIHELPQVAAGVDEPLAEGMVFTVEPGIYVPGVCGVRIEDNVVVTATGCDGLTSFPRELTVL